MPFLLSEQAQITSMKKITQLDEKKEQNFRKEIYLYVKFNMCIEDLLKKRQKGSSQKWNWHFYIPIFLFCLNKSKSSLISFQVNRLNSE